MVEYSQGVSPKQFVYHLTWPLGHTYSPRYCPVSSPCAVAASIRKRTNAKVVDTRNTWDSPAIAVSADLNVQPNSVQEKAPSRVTVEVVVVREATRHKGYGRHALATAAARAHSLARNSFSVITCAMVPRLSSFRSHRSLTRRAPAR